MKKLICCLLLLSLSLTVFCQRKDTVLFSHFQLRQSFCGSDEASSPAQIQFTLPGNGQNSWMVDAAIGVKIDPLSGDYGNSRLTGEYHRNTVISDQQNNYQFGYNYQYLKTNGGLSVAINSNLKFIRDVQDMNSSIGLTANFSPYLAGLHRFNLGRPAYLDNNHFTYTFTPYIELQYQQLFSDAGTTANGGILRPVANISGSLALNKTNTEKKISKPEKLIEFCYGYSARYAVVNSITGENFTKLFKAGFNYYLLDAKSISVSLGANYNTGSDPLYGLKDQHYWQFALQVQI
jgi:hypothetical protein